jgi:hypothetical protein
MSRRGFQNDQDDDEEEDWDNPNEFDEEAPDDEDLDDDRSTVPCPYCRRPVYEDAEYCANCDEYISLEDAPPERKPVWIVWTAVILLATMLLWYLR